MSSSQSQSRKPLGSLTPSVLPKANAVPKRPLGDDEYAEQSLGQPAKKSKVEDVAHVGLGHDGARLDPPPQTLPKPSNIERVQSTHSAPGRMMKASNDVMSSLRMAKPSMEESQVLSSDHNAAQATNTPHATNSTGQVGASNVRGDISSVLPTAVPTQPSFDYGPFPTDITSRDKAWAYAIEKKEVLRWKVESPSLPDEAQRIAAASLFYNRMTQLADSKKHSHAWLVLRAWDIENSIYAIFMEGSKLPKHQDTTLSATGVRKQTPFTGQSMGYNDRVDAILASFNDPSISKDILDGVKDLEYVVVGAPLLAVNRKQVYKRNNDIKAAKLKSLPQKEKAARATEKPSVTWTECKIITRSDTSGTNAIATPVARYATKPVAGSTAQPVAELATKRYTPTGGKDKSPALWQTINVSSAVGIKTPTSITPETTTATKREAQPPIGPLHVAGHHNSATAAHNTPSPQIRHQAPSPQVPPCENDAVSGRTDVANTSLDSQAGDQIHATTDPGAGSSLDIFAVDPELPQLTRTRSWP